MGGSAGAFLNNPAATSGPGYSFAGQSWPLPGGLADEHRGLELDPRRAARAARWLHQAGRDLAPRPLHRHRAQATSSGRTWRSTARPRSPARSSTRTTSPPLRSPAPGTRSGKNAMYYLSKNVFKPGPQIRRRPTRVTAADGLELGRLRHPLHVLRRRRQHGLRLPMEHVRHHARDGRRIRRGQRLQRGHVERRHPQLEREFPMVENLNCTIGAFQVAYGIRPRPRTSRSARWSPTSTPTSRRSSPTETSLAIIGDSFEVVASIANVIAVVLRRSRTDEQVEHRLGDPGGHRPRRVARRARLRRLTRSSRRCPPNTTATAYASMLERRPASPPRRRSSPRAIRSPATGPAFRRSTAGLDLEKNDVQCAETDALLRDLRPHLEADAAELVRAGAPQRQQLHRATRHRSTSRTTRARTPPSLNLPGHDPAIPELHPEHLHALSGGCDHRQPDRARGLRARRQRTTTATSTSRSRHPTHEVLVPALLAYRRPNGGRPFARGQQPGNPPRHQQGAVLCRRDRVGEGGEPEPGLRGQPEQGLLPVSIGDGRPSYVTRMTIRMIRSKAPIPMYISPPFGCAG